MMFIFVERQQVKPAALGTPCTCSFAEDPYGDKHLDILLLGNSDAGPPAPETVEMLTSNATACSHVSNSVWSMVTQQCVWVSEACWLMQVLEYAYDYLAGILTSWENHKTHSAHYNSLLWKQVQRLVDKTHTSLSLSVGPAFPKAALACVYLGTSMPGGDCLSMLRAQISTTLFFLSTFRVFQALESFAVEFERRVF
eukprot:3286505-Amphidinium_carterae.1